MRTWHAQWTLSRPGHDVERGSHTIRGAESEADAIAAVYQHLASINIGDGERLPAGISLSVLPVGQDASAQPMFELVRCTAWLPVVAMSEGLARGAMMAAALGFVLWGLVIFIRSLRDGGWDAVDEGASDWLLTHRPDVGLETVSKERLRPHPDNQRRLSDAEVEKLAREIRMAGEVES